MIYFPIFELDGAGWATIILINTIQPCTHIGANAFHSRRVDNNTNAELANNTGLARNNTELARNNTKLASWNYTKLARNDTKSVPGNNTKFARNNQVAQRDNTLPIKILWQLGVPVQKWPMC